MPCTTILAGKKATWNGSTMIARNDDSGSGHYTPKRFVVVEPDAQMRVYESVLSHVKIPLPENPQRYTAMPNALTGEGIWAACGVNESDVAMTATETITSNPRVQGADPLVEYEKISEDPNLRFGTDALPEFTPEVTEEKPGGIGEEDLVVLTIPYVRSAREGVLRVGKLLETYGTYEENGIAISDVNEVWYLETVGGHHWIAKRVPDEETVVMPNQLGIDSFDLTDAFGEKKENLCSEDLREFIRANHLDLTMEHMGDAAGNPDDANGNPGDAVGNPDDANGNPGDAAGYLDDANGNPGDAAGNPGGANGNPEDAAGTGCDHAGTVRKTEENIRKTEETGHEIINPRILFGSHDDADHVYNTPRAWYMLRYLAPSLGTYDGPAADFRPEDDDLPWSVRPDRKLTPEDVKYLLSSHFQGTEYDPYLAYGDKSRAGAYRSIGVNRTDFLGFAEIRPDLPRGARALEWVAFGSNAFNTMAPFYTDVARMPEYLSNTTETVSTENFYWASRLLAALSDASYGKCQNVIEQYTDRVLNRAHALLIKWDQRILSAGEEERMGICEEANEEIAAMLKKETDHALGKALFFRSNDMKNSYARSDH